MFNKNRKLINLLFKTDDYNTSYFLANDEKLEEHQKQINYLTDSDKHNLWLFDQMTTKIKELEENLRLVHEFLRVHKEDVGIKLVEDDCCCDCEDNWENVCEPENRYTAQEWLAKVKDWGKKFESLKK